MKEKKTGFAAIFLAFITLLIGWLIQEHFVTLVGFWKQARAKVSGEEVKSTSAPSNETTSSE